jgi:hypothetical protein
MFTDCRRGKRYPEIVAKVALEIYLTTIKIIEMIRHKSKVPQQISTLPVQY